MICAEKNQMMDHIDRREVMETTHSISLHEIPEPGGVHSFCGKYAMYIVLSDKKEDVDRLLNHLFSAGYSLFRGGDNIQHWNVKGDCAIKLYEDGDITGPMELLDHFNAYCIQPGEIDSNKCPKCGATMGWRTLALRCDECWYVQQ